MSKPTTATPAPVEPCDGIEASFVLTGRHDLTALDFIL
jgi:hypothetical protein